MEASLSQRVHELVENGWEPLTTTETTASLLGRRPFAWWLFLIVIFLFPLFGGVLYLIFWVATSRATVFLHMENGEMIVSGDQWLIKLQEAKRDAYVDKQRQIKERGFLPVAARRFTPADFRLDRIAEMVLLTRCHPAARCGCSFEIAGPSAFTCACSKS